MHFQHRLHDAGRRRLVLAGDQIDEPLRRDLPAEAELVFQPAAGGLLTAIGCELRPVVVGFLLRVGADHEGNGLAELELRPGIEGDKLNSLELEAGDHHRAGGSGAAFRVARYFEHAGVLENGAVIFGSFFGLMVEPQKRLDFVQHEFCFLPEFRRISFYFSAYDRYKVSRWAGMKPASEMTRRSSDSLVRLRTPAAYTTFSSIRMLPTSSAPNCKPTWQTLMPGVSQLD